MAKKAVKKRWVKLYASKDFNEVELGESYVADPRDCMGRSLTVSLSVLGIDTRQNITITFKVTDIQGEKLICSPIAYRIMPSSVKRMMRRQRVKLEDSFLVISKDGVKLRIKPILVTRFKTTSGVKKILREAARNQIATIVQRTKYIDLLKDVVAHRVQKQLFEKLKKLFPLSVCEIRWLIKVEDGLDTPEQIHEEVSKEDTEPVVVSEEEAPKEVLEAAEPEVPTEPLKEETVEATA